jgi:hypothetical protein
VLEICDLFVIWCLLFGIYLVTNAPCVPRSAIFHNSVFQKISFKAVALPQKA